MQLTVREAAQHLGVDEPTVRRWIAQRALPAHLAHEQSYINAVELWEWAIENGVPVSRRLLNELTDAIRALAQSGKRVQALELSGDWADVRDPEILARLNS